MKAMIFWTGIWGALGIALGAFGAHGLKKVITPESLVVWQTAVQYHLVASAVLLALTIASILGLKMKRSFIWMAIGSILFSGSLYVLTLVKIRYFGIITPFGGLAMISAWIFAIFDLLKSTKERNQII